jgi:hypothetical protein
MFAAAISALILALPATSGPDLRAVPSVVGTARAGSQVTGSSGTWAAAGTISYSYKWSRCDDAGTTCTAIAGAVLPTYLLSSADVGKTVAFSVTAKDSSGTAVAEASLIGPIAPALKLASIGRPVVTGAARIGSTLTVSAGFWTTTPTAVAFAWQRCGAGGRTCTPIAGATSATYVPVAADAGHALVVRVQATAGTATQAVLSLATGVVAAAQTATTTTTTTTPVTQPGPAPAVRPAITGTAKVGQKLSGTPTSGAKYQWYRCDAGGAHCSSIRGAVAVTYATVAADAGKTLGLTVKTATPAYASLVGPIAAATAAAASKAQPAVTGKPIEGQMLTASAGTWTQVPTSVAYAWQRCNANGRICSPIAGATSATYVPVAADFGHELVALVTATVGGATQAALSAATDAIQAPPALAATSLPTIAGTLKVGQRLAGATGVWTGAGPITYAFQWYRCDVNGAHCLSVHGATAPNYKIVAADAGKTIGLAVTATDGTGTKQPAYSALAGPVAASAATLVSSVQPKVTLQGKTLTVDAGTWSAATTSTTYQWQRCNANGRTCTAIAGAAAASYTATPADSGHMLLAVVTAHAGGVTAAALSAAVKAPS